jgi:hypothetical protein
MSTPNPSSKPKTLPGVGCSALLESLALRLERRAIDINCAHAMTGEERAVRRSMVVIYSELAETLRAENGKLSNAPHELPANGDSREPNPL